MKIQTRQMHKNVTEKNRNVDPTKETFFILFTEAQHWNSQRILFCVACQSLFYSLTLRKLIYSKYNSMKKHISVLHSNIKSCCVV